MHILVTIVFCLSLAIGTVQAQFLSIEIPVKAELSAEIEQKLTFQNLQSGSGLHALPLGSNRSGIYAINAYGNQLVWVQILPSAFLKHINPMVQDSVKLQIKAAYVSKNTDNYRLKTLFENHEALFTIYNSENRISEPSDNYQIWKTAYIYMYGSLEVGNVRNGVYEGEILLQIDYL